jgi:integrase
MEAAQKTRNPTRNKLLILLCFEHALRVSELVSIRLDQINLTEATILIKRRKNGNSGIHGLDGEELRLIRRLLREENRGDESQGYLFLSERNVPLSIPGAQKLVERLGVMAGIPFPVHIHSIRHAAGTALANRGVDSISLQAFMGHRNISSTVVYTSISDRRIRSHLG